MLTDLGAVTRSGKFNPLIPFQLVDLLAKDHQKKIASEPYLIYSLYDSDSNQYDQVKIVISKSAENQHEELEDKVYIGKSGYIETFVANETNEDVWFDNFRIQSSTPLVVQETHGACPESEAIRESLGTRTDRLGLSVRRNQGE